MLPGALTRDSFVTEPIAQALAEQMLIGQKSYQATVIDKVNLAAMITGVGTSIPYSAAPQLEINLLDEGWILLDSGFWGTPPTTTPGEGRAGQVPTNVLNYESHSNYWPGSNGAWLDKADINFPVGSKYWWSLRQLNPASDYVVETFWVPRVVRMMMQKHTRKFASRNSETRAQFLKGMFDEATNGLAKFHSKQLTQKQPVGYLPRELSGETSVTSSEKQLGLTADDAKNLTIKGSKITETQREAAATLMQVADEEHAGQVATEAMLFAAIWLSDMDTEEVKRGGNRWGILAGGKEKFAQTAVREMAEHFLKGGKGYKTGGAMKLGAATGSPQEIFAQELARLTGLPENFVEASCLHEESGEHVAEREAENNNDWLNIGYTDSGTYGGTDSIWKSPITAAEVTAKWLEGHESVPGYGVASAAIQALVTKAREGATVAELVALLERPGEHGFSETEAWASSHYFDQSAEAFLGEYKFRPTGPGRLAGEPAGEAGGGQTATGTTPIEIASEVMGLPLSFWANIPGYSGNKTALSEVQAIIKAAGGVSGSGGITHSEKETVETYFYETYTKSEPERDWWTAALDLAQVVNWPLIVDGDDVYYDGDVVLVRQETYDLIERTDDAVEEWNYEWDNRHIATNMEIQLAAPELDPSGKLSYAPPSVVKVKGFGPASEGSNLDAALAGRWLVGEVKRKPGDTNVTLTLVQPTRGLAEPAPKITTEKTTGLGGSEVTGDFAQSGALAVLKAAQSLSRDKLPYLYGGGHSPGQFTNPPPKSGFDCSGAVSWVLAMAALPLPNGSSIGPTGYAAVSGEYEDWGEAGPGEDMTIWCNAEHVFIELNIPGYGHFQLNTSWENIPNTGGHYGPWGGRGQQDAESGRFKARHFKGEIVPKKFQPKTTRTPLNSPTYTPTGPGRLA